MKMTSRDSEGLEISLKEFPDKFMFSGKIRGSLRSQRGTLIEVGFLFSAMKSVFERLRRRRG